MKTTRTIVALLVAAAALAGCYTPGSKGSIPLVMYVGPAKPDTELAQIQVWERSVRRDDFLSKLWQATVIAVDGAPVKEMGYTAAKIQLLPGVHRLTVNCEVTPINYRQTVDIEVTLKAGTYWYPYATVRLDPMGRPSRVCGAVLRSEPSTTGWSGAERIGNI